MEYTKEYILRELEEMADKKYGEFSSSLIPGENTMLGVRIPKLRAFAKRIAGDDYESYLENACRGAMCFEEKTLKGFVIGCIRADTDYIFGLVRDFVPQIDNWSVCDTFCASLKIFGKNLEKGRDFLLPYTRSDKEFEIRFATVMLMDYYLKEDYIDRVLAFYGKIRHEGYYAKMGAAWGLATAYAKFPGKTREFLMNTDMDDWTYNKAIQKMLESYRIDSADKEMLRSMKRRTK
ncbi:MAG: DNA alkylation repair protein [Butyrivibrio sp.]|nr:DNA alkylation repair protein [Butyrivibrio sp.]